MVKGWIAVSRQDGVSARVAIWYDHFPVDSASNGLVTLRNSLAQCSQTTLAAVSFKF